MPNDTYFASNGGRNNVAEMVFDPKTGKWFPSANLPPVSVPSGGSTPPTEKNSEVDSKGEADREYIEQEYNTLEGDLEVVPNDKIIRIGVGDTINLFGFGKVLSGKYYVSGIKRTVTKDEGYSNSLTVMKNGFSDSLKKSPDSTSNARTEVVK